jgi:rSAM/selenodomain-associated transferase 1
MASTCALAVMARYPAVGQVKTRLAAAIGAEGACALYRAFISDIDARFRGGRRKLVWMYAPAPADFAALVAPGTPCLPQEGVELGARMHRAFQRLLAAEFDCVVMIGADVPHVRDEWIDEAESALDSADVVLGPSLDGGYYLIAMRSAHDVFSGVAMGTPHVLSDTRAKAEGAGRRVHLLPPSFDVDDAADLVRLRDVLCDPEMAARLPATAAWLAANAR